MKIRHQPSQSEATYRKSKVLTWREVLMAESDRDGNFTSDLICQQQCVYAVQNARKTHSFAPQWSWKWVKCTELWHQNLLLLQVLTFGTFSFLTTGWKSHSFAIHVPVIVRQSQMMNNSTNHSRHFLINTLLEGTNQHLHKLQSCLTLAPLTG